MPNARTIPTAAALDVVTITVLSEGTEVSRSYQLISVDVSHECNRIPYATLVYKDGDAATGTFEISESDDFVPGKQVQINLGYGAQEEEVFRGIVIGHAIKIRESSAHLFVECKGKAVKMTVGEKSNYFTEQKDSEVMEAVIGQYGLQSAVDATETTHRMLVQAGVTDWDYLLTRADLNGRLVFAEGEKITVAKPDTDADAVLTAVFGSNILDFDAEIDARLQPKTVKAIGWDATDQTLAEAEANEPSANGPGNLSAENIAAVIGLDPLTVRHPGSLGKAELQILADASLQKHRLAKVRGRARFTGTSEVKPGNMVEVQGVGKRFEGKVFVTGVRHQVAAGSWETNIQLGLDPEWFADQVGIASAGAGGMFPPVQGLQAGTVTALEGDPDGEDRIQVRLPLVSADAAGTWARLATLDAGDNRGSFFRPEIGDEVVVGFLSSDPRQAVVLGQLHSSSHPAPEPASDDNHQKGFVSRSEMKWLFDDENKVITFETPGGNKIVLSDADSGITLEDQNGNKIVMGSSGIEITSASALKIEAATDAEVTGSNLTLAGQATTELKASGTLKVNSSGMTEIKGSLVKIN